MSPNVTFCFRDRTGPKTHIFRSKLWVSHNHTKGYIYGQMSRFAFDTERDQNPRFSVKIVGFSQPNKRLHLWSNVTFCSRRRGGSKNPHFSVKIVGFSQPNDIYQATHQGGRVVVVVHKPALRRNPRRVESVIRPDLVPS